MKIHQHKKIWKAVLCGFDEATFVLDLVPIWAILDQQLWFSTFSVFYIFAARFLDMGCLRTNL